MKTKYWVTLIAAVLLVCVGLSVYVLMPKKETAYVSVVQDGVVTMKLDLNKNQVLTLQGANGGKNVVDVRDGKVAVIEASCPDHVCMAMGYCGGGMPIACLPNGLILVFSDGTGADGVAG